MVEVFIADDNALVREGLQRHINGQADMRVVGMAGNGLEVIARAATETWDLLVLDLSMPGCSGIDVVKQLQINRPTLPIVILSMYPEEQHAAQLLALGASAYLSKGRSPAEFLEAVRTVAAGRPYVQPKEPPAQDNGCPWCDLLSPREWEVLKSFCRGATPAALAESLHLSASAVGAYLSRIREKLGVATDDAIAPFAISMGIFGGNNGGTTGGRACGCQTRSL